MDISDGFSDDARISSIHTRNVISKDYVDYFKTLPRVYTLENLFFVHSSPKEPHEYSYILKPDVAAENFREFTEDICFIGHSHKPLMFKETKAGAEIVNDSELTKGCRYIINVGSVGQPRDGDCRLCFGLYDTGSRIYNRVRVDYDAQIASNKIKNEGLPDFLAMRILSGV